ncbi:hypothetical protein DFH09DRAFT_1083314 [Mycena vulgaris]|nr:hypothetical protein DFH09DRAFT_1083314 [Mycena vulgaris]
MSVTGTPGEAANAAADNGSRANRQVVDEVNDGKGRVGDGNGRSPQNGRAEGVRFSGSKEAVEGAVLSRRARCPREGGQLGAHILSGAVTDPSALDTLLPDWRETGHPLSQPMNNEGIYIASLSHVAAWLSGNAEELGVKVYAGFAGGRLLFSTSSDATDAQGPAVRSVRSVLTHDAGLTRQRTKSVSFEPSVGFYARATLLIEGAHGSLSKSATAIYDLHRLGLKEVWRVPKEKHVPGWPLGWGTYCGEWEADGSHIKHHPHFRVLLAAPDAERPAYGARTLSEDRLQNLPQLRFPGGALITGMLAAEAGLHPCSSSPAHPLLPLPPPPLPPPPPPPPTSISASIL